MTRLRMRGFTLIELLVVISIIALLSSIALASFQTAREHARDAVRKAQVSEFKKALQLYYITYGRFPCASAGCTTVATMFALPFFGAQELVNASVIRAIPPDPIYMTTTGNCSTVGVGYCYCSNGGDSYVLTVNTEDDRGGSDRCYIEEGSGAPSLCSAHHGAVGSLAEQACSTRF